MLLKENPHLDLNATAVECALRLDEILQTTKTYHPLDGEVLMDTIIHSRVGLKYDIHDPLNCFGPLLIESGFPVTTETLGKGLKNRLQLWNMFILTNV